MADFNINALGAFRNVDFGNADAIANLKQGGGVEQNGRLGNFIGKMFRTSATKANNNAARTELLKSLGLADPDSHPDLVCVGYMQPEQRDAATRLAARLRADGRSVDLRLRPLKPKQFFAHAGERGTHAVYLGPDDVARGAARMKDLATRAETEIALA